MDPAGPLVEAVRLRERWELAAARRVLVRAVASTQGPLAAGTARRMLAEVLREMGHAEAAYRVAAPLAAEHERTLGSGHPATVRSLGVLATVVHDLGRHAAAAALYRRVVNAPVDPQGPAGRAVSLARVHLALLHRDRGDPARALRDLGAAYALHRRAYGALDVDTIRVGAELAGLHRAAGDVPAARRLLTVS